MTFTIKSEFSTSIVKKGIGHMVRKPYTEDVFQPIELFVDVLKQQPWFARLSSADNVNNGLRINLNRSYHRYHRDKSRTKYLEINGHYKECHIECRISWSSTGYRVAFKHFDNRRDMPIETKRHIQHDTQSKYLERTLENIRERLQMLVDVEDKQAALRYEAQVRQDRLAETLERIPSMFPVEVEKRGRAIYGYPVDQDTPYAMEFVIHNTEAVTFHDEEPVFTVRLIKGTYTKDEMIELMRCIQCLPSAVARRIENMTG